MSDTLFGPDAYATSVGAVDNSAPEQSHLPKAAQVELVPQLILSFNDEADKLYLQEKLGLQNGWWPVAPDDPQQALL
jgi:hypothetical protein